MRRFTVLLLLVVLLGVLRPVTTTAQGTLSTIYSNGPTAKRINLVVLSEGYTSNQLAQFLVDATNAVNNLLAHQQYLEYKNYFNAFAISVASIQSGSDHPNSSPNVSTYFNSSFDSYGIAQFLTIPPNSFDGTYANGQGKVDALLATLMPEYDLVMMVVNDPNYGGSGGGQGQFNMPFITSLHSDAAEIVRHESGHTLGLLADEYVGGAPGGYVPSEKPNSTAVTNRAAIKWTAWISTNTPLPTPANSSYTEVVGLFTGAQYQATGWYRPKYDCKMRIIIQGGVMPFCEVCSEQLVKSIYGLVRPIDTFLPASTNLTAYSTQAVSFSVTALQPLTHDLTVQWYTNNVAVSGATNFTFQCLPKTLVAGTNKVRAVVRDLTPLVRNDPANLLSSSNTWNINVSLNELSLVAARYLSSNRFRVTVTGTAPQGFVLQASTNLSTWVSLTTNNLSGGKYDYTNSGLTNVLRRYYRTRSPP